MDTLRQALGIVERVKSASTTVQINMHQCRRLTEVYDNIGQCLNQYMKANRESTSSSSINMDPLLKVMEAGELLILEYDGPDWFRSLVTRGENQEAFEELHDDLKLWIKSLFGTNVGGPYFFELARDATRDREEMLMKLMDMQEENSSRSSRKKEPRKVKSPSTRSTTRNREAQIPSRSLEVAIQKLRKQDSKRCHEVSTSKLQRKISKFRSTSSLNDMDMYTQRKKREKILKSSSGSRELLLKKYKGRKRSLTRENDRDAKHRRIMYSDDKEDAADEVEVAPPPMWKRSEPLEFLGLVPSEDSHYNGRVGPDPDSVNRPELGDDTLAYWGDPGVTVWLDQNLPERMEKKASKSKKKSSLPAEHFHRPKEFPLVRGTNTSQVSSFSRSHKHIRQRGGGIEMKKLLSTSSEIHRHLTSSFQMADKTEDPGQDITGDSKHSVGKESEEYASHITDVTNRISVLSLSPSTVDIPDGLTICPSEIKVTQRVLGAGTYSEVKEAEWLGCKYAVKILKTQNVNSLKREVAIHEALRHPHIVQLMGFSADRDTCMILMELMDINLHDLIISRSRRMSDGKFGKPPFRPQEAVDLMLQIVKGMVFLHRRGVLHGDLKPANVLVEQKRNNIFLKITDFGVSRYCKTGVDDKPHYTGNTGTGYFRAPEVLEGTGTYSFKADIYSFAMTSYEILTGWIPFHDRNQLPSRHEVINGERPSLPDDMHESLRDLLEVCWHGEQEKRPDFSVILDQLQRLKETLEVSLRRGWSRLGSGLGSVWSGVARPFFPF